MPTPQAHHDTGGERTRILVADTISVFRLGLICLLGNEPDFDIVGEAWDARTAIDRARDASPDIVLVDLALPPQGGIAITQWIKRHLPRVEVVVLAASEDEDVLFDAVRAGASAFIVRDVGLDDLVTFVRQVVAGEDLLSNRILSNSALASRVINEYRKEALAGRGSVSLDSPLTARESKVLDMIAQGMTNRQIAEALEVSVQTVKNHVMSVFRRLGVKHRTEAIAYAVRRGWIRMPPTDATTSRTKGPAGA